MPSNIDVAYLLTRFESAVRRLCEWEQLGDDYEIEAEEARSDVDFLRSAILVAVRK